MLIVIDHGNKHQNRSHLNNITSQNNNQSNCENILLCHKCIVNCRRYRRYQLPPPNCRTSINSLKCSCPLSRTVSRKINPNFRHNANDGSFPGSTRT